MFIFFSRGHVLFNYPCGGFPPFHHCPSVTVRDYLPPESRLFQKPLLLNTLHGGGLIFDSQTDAHVKLIAYWINHPMPKDQDEFSSAGNGLFTPADAATGTCNTL